MRLPILSPRVRAALVAAPMILMAAGPAWAQIDSREAIALRNDIYQLQQQIQVLQQQAARGGAAGPTYLGGSGGYPAQSGSNDMVAQLLARVDDLADQVRQLRGRVEEAENKIQQQGADLGKRIDDLAFQVQNGGAAPAAGLPPDASQPMASSETPTTSPPPGSLGATIAPPPPPPPHPAPTPRTPEAAIREGTAALARRDYPAAEAAAREVLTRFRTSPRAYDAQYLLAQALAGGRHYPQAAIAYDDAYNRSRRGAHAQEALLGLASALTAINEKKAACDTLVKLRREFPQQQANMREAAAALHQRAACR